MPVVFTGISGRNQKRRSVIIFAAMVIGTCRCIATARLPHDRDTDSAEPPTSSELTGWLVLGVATWHCLLLRVRANYSKTLRVRANDAALELVNPKTNAIVKTFTVANYCVQGRPNYSKKKKESKMNYCSWDCSTFSIPSQK